MGTFAGAAAGLTAAVAVAAAATTGGVLTTSAASGPVAVAAAAGGGYGVWERLIGTLASGLLAVSRAVVGLNPGESGGDGGAGVTVEGLLVRAIVWGLVCAAAWGVREGLVGLEQRFYKGEYPPQRNVDKS